MLQLLCVEPGETFKLVSEVFKIIAYSAAALFFLWKFVSGYMVSNLSLDPIVKRQKHTEGNDYLLIDLKLIKGDRESVVLIAVSLSMKEDTADPININLESPTVVSEKRMIRMSPGEITQFSHLFTVAASSCCTIEFHIKGHAGIFSRAFGRYTGHWKASVISLPLDQTNSNNNL